MVNKWLGISDRTVSHNFWFNVCDGAFYIVGMSFVGMVTVLPVFVKKLGGSEVAVGLIPVLWALGFNLPQILIAPHVRSLEVKKKFVLATAVFQRIPWLMLGIMSLFINSLFDLKTGLTLFFILFFITALTSGINLPGWFDLISKITPVNLRGRLFGLRSIIGSFLGIIGGFAVHAILGSVAFPINFSLLFFCGFIFTVGSFIFIAFLKEEEQDEFVPLIRGWRKFTYSAGFLKNDLNFISFIVADVLMILSFTGNAFITVYALGKFGVPDENIGFFTVLMMGSLIVSSLIFGTIGDRSGHKLNMILASFFTLSATLLAVLSKSVAVFYFVFVLTSVTTGIMMVSRLTLLAELSPSKERASYIGLTSLIGLPFAFSAIIGGWAAKYFGFEIVFILSAICAGCAMLVWTFFVKEPRFLPARTIPGKTFGD